MNLLLKLLVFICLFSISACSQNKQPDKEEQDVLQLTYSLNKNDIVNNPINYYNPENFEEFDHGDDDIIPQKNFRELVSNIPISPLPFGVKNIDSINVYKPLGERLPPIEFDTLDIYGMKNYFINHPELDIKDEREGRFVGDRHVTEYFVKRFPPLKNGNEVLLFYKYNLEKNNESWILYLCKSDDGKIIDSDRSFMSSNGGGGFNSFSYMDDNYVITKKLFCLPRKPGQISGIEFGDDVEEDIIKANKTILYFRYVYKFGTHSLSRGNLSKEKAEYLHEQFYWKDNRPVVFHRFEAND
ncbi:MAG: hypothetical protein FWF54_00530 [Candidatus Azobacteroides sp.]|nr:hypothetical protein [Candidatus Azobacteroides sp.]